METKANLSLALSKNRHGETDEEEEGDFQTINLIKRQVKRFDPLVSENSPEVLVLFCKSAYCNYRQSRRRLLSQTLLTHSKFSSLLPFPSVFFLFLWEFNDKS